MTQLVNSREG